MDDTRVLGEPAGSNLSTRSLTERSSSPTTPPHTTRFLITADRFPCNADATRWMRLRRCNGSEWTCLHHGPDGRDASTIWAGPPTIKRSCASLDPRAEDQDYESSDGPDCVQDTSDPITVTPPNLDGRRRPSGHRLDPRTARRHRHDQCRGRRTGVSWRWTARGRNCGRSCRSTRAPGAPAASTSHSKCMTTIPASGTTANS